jgi:hypothetical protein
MEDTKNKLRKHHAIVTEETLVLSLGPELHEKIKSCIERSGSAKVSLHEITVSRVPEFGVLTSVIVD